MTTKTRKTRISFSPAFMPFRVQKHEHVTTPTLIYFKNYLTFAKKNKKSHWHY